MGRRIQSPKKIDVETNGGSLANLQVTDQFLFRCGVENLVTINTLVQPVEVETMPLTDIKTLLKNNLRPRKRLVNAEQTKYVAITQKNGKSPYIFWPDSKKQ